MKQAGKKRTLPKAEGQKLLAVLEARFAKHPRRHEGIQWAAVREKLGVTPEKLWSLAEMERTGGEPDVIGHDRATGEFIFADCSEESPAGRRSLCYDREALESRKEHRPENSAMDLAEEMGIRILTEEEYVDLQKLGEFDRKTSSWLAAPAEIRKHGGGIFGDRRYGRVFIYHNGAQSYYAGRAFRGSLRV